MNKNVSRKPRLALIAGPTASGKSALALALAEQTGGTIVNADASQVYRDLPILSAQPTPSEQAQVPHRLFGTLDASVAGSAAQWAADASTAIAEVHAAEGLPILVGGSGLYIRTLLDGIAPVPAIDAAVRDAVRRMPQHQARAALEEEDAATAMRLHPSDHARTVRALEVIRATGVSLATWQQHRVGGIAAAVELLPLILLPPREDLYPRCDARFAAMIEAGALQEVSALLDRALPPTLPAMRMIGVRELAANIRSEQSTESAIAKAQQATRRYAKRQYTWFAHQLPPAWHRLTQCNDTYRRFDVTKLFDLG